MYLKLYPPALLTYANIMKVALCESTSFMSMKQQAGLWPKSV